MSKWTAADIPDQTGKIAIVTGASNGIGLATAEALAGAGATVILAVRNAERGNSAAERIRAAVPAAQIEVQLLELADLNSVKAFAERVIAKYPRIDLLINNAGTFLAPVKPTVQGHEQHFGINYLGHFALTLRLLPVIGGPDPRVVSVSSWSVQHGILRFENLAGAGRWDYLLYAQSKLANLLFSVELGRRLQSAGSPVISVAAHPGFTGTNLAKGISPSLGQQLLVWMFPRAGMSLADGARPTLYAATMPKVRPGDFYGPQGFVELYGGPGPSSLRRYGQDADKARRLWEVSEQLTGLSMP